MPTIISCSRRTDLPGFYTPWLMNRIHAGFCHVLNPYGGQVYRVSLKPEDVIAWGFWTRNPAPLMPHLDELDRLGYKYYFHTTITGYPQAVEPFNPPLETRIANAHRLAERVSPESVIWRYDPVLVSQQTPASYHLEHFAAIARQLEGATRQCVFSFALFYGKTGRNLGKVTRETGNRFFNPSQEEQRELARQLAEIAARHGIQMTACCADHLVFGPIQKTRCVDPAQIARLRPELTQLPKPSPSRPGCGCIASVDIGAYETCGFGCAYCYATNDSAEARRRIRQHDPEDTILFRPPELAGKDLDEIAVAPKTAVIPPTAISTLPLLDEPPHTPAEP